MREVTIASQIGCGRRLNAGRTAFSEAMTRVDRDWDWYDAGVHQVLTVARAVHKTEANWTV